MIQRAQRAWERWLRAAGPWRGYCQCPVLLSPSVSEVAPHPFAAADHATRLAHDLAPALHTGGVLCLLDLEPALGLAVAAELNAARLAHPVPMLPRWPYAEAVLPVDQLLHALLSGARRLAPDAQRLPNVVLVLDGERATLLPDRPRADPRADNRHTVFNFDLPNLPTLRQRGIGRVIRVTRGAP
jgi:hypothetical protein